MHRLILLLALAPVAVHAQTVKTYRSKEPPRAPVPRAASYNSASKDTTPLDCEKYRTHPHPGMIGFCHGMENSLLQNEARRQGRPTPSRSVVRLPAMGTQNAKELGYACIGGTAMRRLSNGWEQVTSGAGWQRCTEG